MRTLLVLLVIGCGGGTTAPPSRPVSNATIAKSDPAPATEPVRLQPCPPGDSECVMVQMDIVKMKMCTCLDKKCADSVNDEMVKWSQEMAKTATKASAKPDDDLVKRMTDTMTQYSECYTKLAMAGMDANTGSGAP